MIKFEMLIDIRSYHCSRLWSHFGWQDGANLISKSNQKHGKNSLVLQNKKKFYLIGTNASDIGDCTLQAIEKVKHAKVVVLSKKFDSLQKLT